MKLKNYRLFMWSIVVAALVMAAKYGLHLADWEGIVLGSLHSSVLAGGFFVIGFLLSATIADYKESERIPAEFAAILENMSEDAISIYRNNQEFKLNQFQHMLSAIATSFGNDVRTKSAGTQMNIHKLSLAFADMETAGVAANFIVKLKTQQARLIHILFRVNYIQRITFIPSATILTRAIVVFTLSLLVFTEVEPFYGGLTLVGIISFIMTYIMLLIRVIGTPFQREGATQDDVSLFLVDQTARHIQGSSTHKA